MLTEKSKNYNPWFDLFRGLAALLVCVSHVRNAFWVDYSEIQLIAWWHTPVYLLTGSGHQAVIIFFVLSGFLVGGGVISKSENFSWKDYISSRLVRLWVVLIPALIFTAACDYLTMRIQPDAFNGDLSAIWNSGPSTVDGFSFKVFSANIVFLQNILVPVYGSNGPLWSLANEFWYYFLFPLFFFGFSNRTKLNFINRLVKLMLAFATCMWLPSDIILYFAIWLMGVASFWITRRIQKKVSSLLIAVDIVFLGCAFILAKFSIKSEYSIIWSDLVVGVLFSFLLIAMGGYKKHWIGSGRCGYCIKLLSDFSYSLYLFHFPLVVMLAVIFVGKSQMQPDFYSFLIVSGITALSLVVAWIAWFIFERHSERIRGAVREFGCCTYLSKSTAGKKADK